MPSTISRKLLVEGNTDKRVIPFLMEANGVEWEKSGEPVVCIAPYGSVDELLKPGVVEAELRASRLEALGLMVDANGDAFDRWNRIRSLCHDEFEHLPDRIPRGELEIVHPESDVRFGVWIMPDNRFSGMLEDSDPVDSGGFPEFVRVGRTMRRRGRAQRCSIQGCPQGESKDLHLARVAGRAGKTIAPSRAPSGTGPRKTGVAAVRRLVQEPLQSLDCRGASSPSRHLDPSP